MESVGMAEVRARFAGFLTAVARRRALPWAMLDGAAFLNGLALLVAANLFFIRPVPALLQRWDEAYAMAFAQRMIAGHDLPYVDAVSQKGPVFYWVVDLAVRVFGADSWLPMRLLALGSMTLTVSLAFAASCAAGRSLAGALMVLAYFAVSMTGGGEGVAGFVMPFCSEHLANVFGMGALLAMTLAGRRRGGPALVGLAGAFVMLATLSKQVALTLAIPMGLWALVAAPKAVGGARPERRSFVLAFAAGLAAPLALVLVRYAAAGALGPLVYYALTYNATVFVPAVRGAHLTQYLTDLFQLQGALVMVAAALGGWALARHLRLVRRAGDLVEAASLHAFECAVGGSALATVAIALLARRTFAHYYVLPLPWFCLLGGLVVDQLVSPPSAAAARHPARTLLQHAAAVAPLLVLVNLAWSMKRKTLPEEAGFQEALKTPAWDLCKIVEERTRPGDSIFVWGFDPMAYTACHRRPASRFVFTIFQTGYVPLLDDPADVERARVVPGSQEALLDDLRHDPPAAIFDASETMFHHRLLDQAFLRPLLAEDYCEAPAAGRMAWVRKPPAGCPPATPESPDEERPLRLYVAPRATARRGSLEARAEQSDAWTMTRPDEIARATAAGYEQRPATGWDFPGAVLVHPVPGTIPLTLYYNRRTGDHFTAASPEARYEADTTGYEVVDVEGYIYPEERPDTIALKLFYSTAARDHLTTASAADEGFARFHGYFLVRIEGYVPRV